MADQVSSVSKLVLLLCYYTFQIRDLKWWSLKLKSNIYVPLFYNNLQREKLLILHVVVVVFEINIDDHLKLVEISYPLEDGKFFLFLSIDRI